ncbi:MAG: hypothetical protein ACE5HU_02300 [Acidobacteriota bacterium]
MDDTLKDTTLEANTSRVSFYTVHASGLQDLTPAFSRDSLNTQVDFINPTTGHQGATTVTSRLPDDTLPALHAGLDSALSLQTTLATETGGRALQRTNDVASIIASASKDLSCYYLIGIRYDLKGDGARHAIDVRLNRPSGRPSRRGLSIRYRPYFMDISPSDRRERVLRSARQAPGLYTGLGISNEAFILAPEGHRRRVLIKTTVSLASLSLVPAGRSTRRGMILASGEVVAPGGEVACRFEHPFEIHVSDNSPTTPTTLVHQTGCLIEPGRYSLAVAIMDTTTAEVGSRRSLLVVPPAGPGAEPYLSDVHLWADDPAAILVTQGDETLGLKQTNRSGGFIPMAERRIGPDQDALLSFQLCPPRGSAPTLASPIHLTRSLLGADDVVVADLRPLLIADPPDEETGCYKILNMIPAGTLGDGVYTLQVEARGKALGHRVTAEAALAVRSP